MDRARPDIRELRRRLGVVRREDGWPLTQQELADVVGVHRVTVSEWENGRTHPSGSAWLLLQRLIDEVEAEETRG